MFELHIADLDATSGSVPVSWCLNQELVDKLKEMDVKDPQVILCVVEALTFNEKKEFRKVVPLSDLMTYVSFRCAGPNRIYGFISKLSHSDAVNRYLHKENGHYTSSLFRNMYDDKAEKIIDLTINVAEMGYGSFSDQTAEPLEIEVPNLCFAKEPYQWEKEWVNNFFRDKCPDQCAFRKRRIFAYTLQFPLLMVLFVVKFILTMFALSVGARGVSLRPLFSPLSYSVGDTWDQLLGEGSFFISEEKPWLFIFMPLIIIPVLLFLWFAKWQTIGIVVLAVIGFISLMLVIALSVDKEARKEFFNFWSNLFHKDKTNLLSDEEVALLLCNGQNATTVNKLPKQKRTIKLRYQQLKSRVCKPYSL